MGQRLVIQVFKNKNSWGEEVAPLLSIYYHWSADASEALATLSGIAKNLKGESFDDFIETLSHTKARLCSEDVAIAQEMSVLNSITPTHSAPLDRNEGLVAVSDDICESYSSIADAIVEVYLEEREFDFAQFLDMAEILNEDNPNELPDAFQELPFVPLKPQDIKACEQLMTTHPRFFNI
ncbi:MAG: hypothetical protein ACRCZZ_06870 [Phocaeicola sp.]